MQWFNDLLQHYGHSVGLSNFQCNESGVAGLDFDNGDRLVFEGSEEGMIVSLLKRSRGYELSEELQIALSLCHYNEGSSFAIQPGMLGDDIISFSVYLPRDKSVASELQLIVDKLLSVKDTLVERI